MRPFAKPDSLKQMSMIVDEFCSKVLEDKQTSSRGRTSQRAASQGIGRLALACGPCRISLY